MSDTPDQATCLSVTDLPQRKPYRFDLTLDDAACDALAHDLDLSALRKLRFTGILRADGKSDWRMDADIGATVVQPCVVTLAPVTTRIKQTITRRFVKDWQEPETSDEIEMPDDDTLEPLTPEIDLIATLREALALALPDYPRAPDATLNRTTFAADGVTPLSDEDVKPFAGLAALKQKLEKPGD